MYTARNAMEGGGGWRWPVLKVTSIIIIVNIGHGQNSNTKKNNNNKRSPTIDLYERKNNNSNVDKTITTTTTKSYAAKNFVVIFIQQIEMIAHLMILISYFSMLLLCVWGTARYYSIGPANALYSVD